MRNYLTESELLAKLNLELQSDETCADCRFEPPIRRVSPPRADGLNWSPDSLILRCSGAPVEVCKNHARATVARIAREFALRHDDGWLYDVSFTHAGKQFTAVNEAIGVSTSGPAPPSNARWAVSVDGGSSKAAFESSLNDTDADSLKERIIKWQQATHGA
jgi:hypothetical protein